MSREKAAKIVLKTCMGLKSNESILIVTDKRKKKLAGIFLKEAKRITKRAKLIETKIAKVSGEEPPKNIADEMQNYDVELLITTKSLSHTKARKKACKNGSRIASMPGLKSSVLNALDIDYRKIVKVNNRLIKMISKGNKMRVTTKKGTDLTMDIRGRRCFDDNGLLNKKGSFGNLPAGEVAVAPLERKTEGIYVVDASQAGLGKLKKPIQFHIRKGYAKRIVGDKRKTTKLKKLLKNKEYRGVAEFGIGTNPKARVTGIILEDEKALKTVHIAIGNNVSFGGRLSVPVHLDGVILKPSVYLDDKIIMKEGKLVL